MSWMQKLFETYERRTDPASQQLGSPPAPPFHVIQQAHLEVAIDGVGNFRRAKSIDREDTLIPATEKSSTARTSGVVPHPLCDHIKYCAADFLGDGNEGNLYFDAYRTQLNDWCASPHAHPKAIAVLRYLDKKTLLQDLIREKAVPVDDEGRMLNRWDSRDKIPHLFKQLTKDSKTQTYKPQNALIRWIVESDHVPEAWKDQSVQEAWIAYCSGKAAEPAFCHVTGENRALAVKHPKGLRNGKDGAKLISNKKEDESDFIYLGRFLHADQVVGVGLDVTQKAHSALQWLIKRQGFRNGDQVIVAWAVSGKPLPDLVANSAQLFGLESAQEDAGPAYQGDAGQSFALRLNKCIAGYRAQLGSTDEIVVMALDSATPGRMAITYYRELTGSEFLERLEAWHESSAWHQTFGRQMKFVGAPSPTDIAEAAYGHQLEGKSGAKLRKATVERLLPCIIDGQPIPRDLVVATTQRAANRAGTDKWTFDKKLGMEVNEWEKNLGVACALFRTHYKQRSYQMALELDRTSRDYLYGRLLAVAESIEEMALLLAKEKRSTNAARLMQRFADHPYSTWRTIELSLVPYKARLETKAPVFLREKKQLLDEINWAFDAQDFVSEARLTGEFLLGYHCQRLAPRPKREAAKDEANPENQTDQGE
ncbi:MAG: type I-C CRISPR-associated protein Cas8c/Csd1 [Burkholderiales bacterium RIFCSPHIGHO2_12_FULL_61_11]|nr:MAG: type I-C CRISPR-associated protein Cas8c/Csd1 [Burkholderiales bacterium RIFCSPHIGHO2_12_FULL_61_11]